MTSCHADVKSCTAHLAHYLQAKDEEAVTSRDRAQDLQQLAAGSAVPSEASQLAAAAQQCRGRADQAAQLALLARAEAARLSGTALAGLPGSALALLLHPGANAEVSLPVMLLLLLQCVSQQCIGKTNQQAYPALLTMAEAASLSEAVFAGLLHLVNVTHLSPTVL